MCLAPTRVTLGQCSGHWGQISSRDNPAHLESLGESLRAQLCVLALTWPRPSIGRLMQKDLLRSGLPEDSGQHCCLFQVGLTTECALHKGVLCQHQGDPQDFSKIWVPCPCFRKASPSRSLELEH